MTDILSNQKTIIPLINFLDATGRFQDKEKHTQEMQADAQDQDQDQDQEQA